MMLSSCLSKLRVKKLTALALAYLLAGALFALPPAPARAASAAPENPAPADTPNATANAYRQTNLVSDLPGVAFVEDPLLVNPWGISMTSTSPFWVANTFTSTSTLYRGDVGGSPLVRNPGLGFVTIPGPGNQGPGLPTGTVANTTNDFVVSSGTASGPARFIFATLRGTIVGWNPNVPSAGSTVGTVAVTVPGAVYTGLAIGNNGTANFLYAADVAQRRIQVFAPNYQPVVLVGSFTDPTLPADYSPFNVQALNGRLYVAYAKIDPMTGLDIEGVGNGIVSTFDFNGNFLGRLITGGQLNSPWGMTIAPATFGAFPNALLVGNFGRGGPSINAYDPNDGTFLGSLHDEGGQPIQIQELWGLTFGNGVNGGDPNKLYFAAGIDEERHGLFGSIAPADPAATSLVQFSSATYTVGEGAPNIQITVTRSGDTSTGATVNYATFDGTAQQRGDYEIALGTLRFNPGETSRTFRIFPVDDAFDDNDETVNLVLSNPVGAGLGTPNTAVLTITDNDATTGAANPIDDAAFFVRQHYLDFLNREPDAPGLAFWTNEITSCGSNAACIEQKRINVSAAFFLSIEFQRTGFLVYLTHHVAFGGLPRYGQFMRDTQAISRDVIIGQPGADAQIEANTQAFFDDFVTRPEFVARYGGLDNLAFVDALLQTAGYNGTVATLWLTRLDGSQEVPPRATPSTGVGMVRLLPGNTQISVSVSFTPLTTPQTDAHIHGPASPGVNAPVIIPLPLGQFRDFRTNITPAQLQMLGNGQTYINVHSQMFPGGEIRGNLLGSRFIRDVLFDALESGLLTRAQVLRIVAETEEIRLRERNRAFVLMQYFGYLRRNPDDPPDNSLAGFNFWLNKLNQFNGDFIAAEMVKGFITSGEYRSRFGNP